MKYIFFQFLPKVLKNKDVSIYCKKIGFYTH